MNQIPNIEEELEKYFYSHFSIPDYDNLPTEIRLTKAEFLEKYKQLHHHQLQKAREEERKRIANLVVEHSYTNDYGDYMGDSDKILQAIHSELDQDKQ